MLIKVGKKNVVFIYCTEQLNLKNISYWHYFMTKIMSIYPIWNFTLYVTQSSFCLKSPICTMQCEVNCPIKLFADDTSIYAIVDNPLITSLSLNSDLQKVQNWSNRWLVNFNPKKTESMIFHERSSPNSILHFILIMFPLKM